VPLSWGCGGNGHWLQRWGLPDRDQGDQGNHITKGRSTGPHHFLNSHPDCYPARTDAVVASGGSVGVLHEQNNDRCRNWYGLRGTPTRRIGCLARIHRWHWKKTSSGMGSCCDGCFRLYGLLLVAGCWCRWIHRWMCGLGELARKTKANKGARLLDRSDQLLFRQRSLGLNS
jgi:hypothetical protein